jgi:hypothetical protein
MYCYLGTIAQGFSIRGQSHLDIEASQLESIAAIQRLTLLALSVAVRTLQIDYS